MKCLCSGEQMRLIDEQDNNQPPDLAVNSALSASAAEKVDNVNFDELELSLRETSSLNHEVRFSSSPLTSQRTAAYHCVVVVVVSGGECVFGED